MNISVPDTGLLGILFLWVHPHVGIKIIINIRYINDHHPGHLGVDGHHHPDHLGVLLRDGVKDMGDLAVPDSQSIRPIHPNLLFRPDDDHADDEDGVSDDEDDEDEVPLCQSIGPNLLFCLWARMLSIPFVQGGNNTNRKE